jgi:hypothetical protein
MGKKDKGLIKLLAAVTGTKETEIKLALRLAALRKWLKTCDLSKIPTIGNA